MSRKKQLYIAMLGAVMSTSLLVIGQVQAEIFKCVNQKGAVYYNDKPCQKKDTETQIKNIKDPKGVTTPAQVLPDLQVADSGDDISNKELTNLRNQQRFNYMREQPASDEEMDSLLDGDESLDFEGE